MRQKSPIESSSARAFGSMPSPANSVSGSLRELPQRGAEHLAPLTEGGSRDPLQHGNLAARLRRWLWHEFDYGRRHFGAWREGGCWQREQDSRLGPQLAQHREPAVIAAARLGDDAERDLALEHEHQAVEPWRPRFGFEPADEKRCGDTIGKVGNDTSRRLDIEAPVVDRPRVGGDDFEPPRIGCGNLVQSRAGSARPSRWR